MARPKKIQSSTTESVSVGVESPSKGNMSVGELSQGIAGAVAQAIEASRPQKKTIFTRVKGTPWTPKDGSPKAKFKRKAYQHSLPLDEKFMSNEEITLFNQLRPGTYCDGLIRVTKRRDKGMDLTYPVKTNSQRLKLVAEYGLTNLTQIMNKCILEASQPRKSEFAEDNT